MESLEFEHALFLEYMRLFDKGEFYESHEAMEKLWIKHGRRKGDAYQGYVQLAACLEQHKRGQTAGAERLFVKAREKLDGIRDDAPGTAAILNEIAVFLEAKSSVLPYPKFKGTK